MQDFSSLPSGRIFPYGTSVWNLSQGGIKVLLSLDNRFTRVIIDFDPPLTNYVTGDTFLITSHAHACQLASKSRILAYTIFPSQTLVYTWPVCVILQLLHILFRFHAGFSCGEELKVQQPTRRKDILRLRVTAGNLHPRTSHTYAHTQFLCQFRIAELRNHLLHQDKKLVSDKSQQRHFTPRKSEIFG